MTTEQVTALGTAIVTARQCETDAARAVAVLCELVNTLRPLRHVAVVDSIAPLPLIHPSPLASVQVDTGLIQRRASQVYSAFRQWHAALQQVRDFYSSLGVEDRQMASRLHPELREDATLRCPDEVAGLFPARQDLK